MIEIDDKVYNMFHKNNFEVVIDDLDITRLYVNSIHLNKLSKSGTVTMYVNEDTLEWLNSLQKAQSAKMKYTVYSPDGLYKNVIYDGGIVIDDVVYECSTIKESDKNRVMLINIEFSTSDRHVIKS